MKLGLIEIAKTAALAPMAGVADRAFREICVSFGAAYVVGEMASAKGMQFNNTKTAQLLGLSESERPGAVQLFGDHPKTMAQAAVMAMQYKPDVLDINMGCPAPKVAKTGSGSALMKNLPLAGEIIHAVVSSVDIPVTVKIRTGWDSSTINGIQAAIIAEENGAAAVTVHGRTRAQMYSPPVDINYIAQVKAAVSIPVIANGDIIDVKSAVEMYKITGCDLVMIGRGALGTPWIFRDIAHYMQTGEVLPQPSLREKMDIMLRHMRLACEYKGEYAAMRESRKHAAWYIKGLVGAANFRRRCDTLESMHDLEKLAEIVVKSERN